MNIQETIKDVEGMRGLCKYNGDCMGCDICYTSIPLAVSALEKQIPKKIKAIEIPQRPGTSYYCPVCNKQQKHTYKNRQEGCFCERCGQKLDWSEADESGT